MKKIITISILYLVICSVVPLPVFTKITFNYKWFVHDFNQPGTMMWLLRDFCYVLGMMMLSFFIICYGSNDFVIKKIGWIFFIDSIWETFDLILYNNEYDPVGNIINNLILIISLLVLLLTKPFFISVKSLFKKTTH